MSVRFPDGVPVLADPVRGVHLRPHREEDLPALVDQCRDPDVVRWTTVPPGYDEAAGRAFLAQVAAEWEQGRATWAIEADRGGRRRYCGSIALRPQEPGSADVGYVLHPDARGLGYASAALRLARDHAFDVLGCEVLRWRCVAGNWASRRTAAAAGFVVDGTVRRLLRHHGVWVDGWLATLLADDARTSQQWLDPPLLAGHGVRLRRVAECDLPRIVEACRDPRTRHWLASLPDPYTASSAAAFLEQTRESAAVGLGWTWAVTTPEDDRMLGSLSLDGFYGYARRAEIGYWAHPDARGRGLLTRAVRLVTEHAETSHLTSSLLIRCGAGNTASRQVAEANGYREVGIMRAAEAVGDGSLVDLVLYARP